MVNRVVVEEEDDEEEDIADVWMMNWTVFAILLYIYLSWNVYNKQSYYNVNTQVILFNWVCVVLDE